MLDPQLRKMDERVAPPSSWSSARRQIRRSLRSSDAGSLTTSAPAGGCEENSMPSRILICSPGFSSRKSQSPSR